MAYLDVFGMDFANPQTAQTLVGGGLTVITLFVLWKIVGNLLSHYGKGEVNEGALIDVVGGVLLDMRQSFDRLTHALENNNEIMAELKKVIEQDRAYTSKAISKVELRVDVIEDKLADVHHKVTRIENAVVTDHKE